MKLNFLLAFLFLAFVSIVIIANEDETDLIGCTELNGMGCVCHTVERDYSVNVWVEGPETLFVGQTGMYKMLMSGGPAEAGGYNVAGRFGEMVLVDSFSYQNPLAMNELTQAFSLPFPTPQDTIYWHFGYNVPDSSITTDTIYSCGLSLVWDSIPDFHDRWNFGPKFPVVVMEGQIPVELVSFNANVRKDHINLEWLTATELNNSGFEIMRSFDLLSWQNIGFVSGHETSTERQYYSFNDYQNKSTDSYYQLKQIDHNGSYTLSKIVEVHQNVPNEFILNQNYPNPFNPTTNIRFVIPNEVRNQEDFSSRTPRNDNSLVTLKIFDVLGNELATLMNEEKSPGEYEVNFDAAGLTSGLYFYRLTAGSFSETKKMLLLK